MDPSVKIVVEISNSPAAFGSSTFSSVLLFFNFFIVLIFLKALCAACFIYKLKKKILLESKNCLTSNFL